MELFVLLQLAAAAATYIYCGYQSQLGMTQKAEKGQHYSTLKSQKKVREPLFSSYRYYFRLSEQEHTQYSNTHYISNIVDVVSRYNNTAFIEEGILYTITESLLNQGCRYMWSFHNTF